MNDFEKIFSDKLHNYKTPPPTNGWDQLNAALDDKKKAKRKIVFWRAAAAVLLLFVAGVSWWGIQPQSGESSIADENSVGTTLPQVDEQEQPSAPLAFEEENAASLQAQEQDVPQNKMKVEETEPQKTDEKAAKSSAKKEKPQHDALPQTESLLASAEEEKADVPEVQPLEEVQAVEALAVEPLILAKDELLALEPMKTKVSTPVTIIYKPGNVPDDDDKNLAMELLSELKNTNISFSEIRNAKAELLAKVFSKKENEVSP
ncbi:hypothetical protein WJR50_30260 [Catalinimonas sp. 4WD22]|uniref:hypothetical protein n=1 Tax=Catalinimonas locisalis TaxID=3133978 RepID=UPI003100DFD1